MISATNFIIVHIRFMFYRIVQCDFSSFFHVGTSSILVFVHSNYTRITKPSGSTMHLKFISKWTLETITNPKCTWFHFVDFIHFSKKKGIIWLLQKTQFLWYLGSSAACHQSRTRHFQLLFLLLLCVLMLTYCCCRIHSAMSSVFVVFVISIASYSCWIVDTHFSMSRIFTFILCLTSD